MIEAYPGGYARGPRFSCAHKESSLLSSSLTYTHKHETNHPLTFDSQIAARIRGYDAVDSLRSLTTDHLNSLVCVRGVVLRRTGESE